MFKDILQGVTDVLTSGIIDQLYSLKRIVLRSLVEVAFLATSVLCVVFGVLLLALIYLPLDLLAMLLIILGLIGFSATLLFIKLN